MTKRATKKPSKRLGKKAPSGARAAGARGVVALPRRRSSALDPGEDARFAEVVALIEAARSRAYQAVNVELVSLYWQLGEHISRKIANAEWGDGVVDELAAALARRFPGLRGFTRPNLFRMRQFYEAYRGNEKVSALLRQLPTHHLLILSQAKPAETREFYMLSAIRERWSSRELERQIQSGAILRGAPAAKKVSAVLARTHPAAIEELKNVYSLEFLSLPDGHSEADLHRALVRNLGRFITELGRDFCFVGSEYPVQVGKQDFAIDLVFFHRGLTCLVAFELKVGKFEPEHLGKLSFYVEALDRDVRKPHERLRSASCSASSSVPAPSIEASSPTSYGRAGFVSDGAGSRAEPGPWNAEVTHRGRRVPPRLGAGRVEEPRLARARGRRSRRRAQRALVWGVVDREGDRGALRVRGPRRDRDLGHLVSHGASSLVRSLH